MLEIQNAQKPRQVQASEIRRDIFKYRLLAAGLGKSRQVEASEPRREIPKYRLLATGLGKYRQV
eukprot:10802786-Karenia_brevis.AAC.1